MLLRRSDEHIFAFVKAYRAIISSSDVSCAELSARGVYASSARFALGASRRRTDFERSAKPKRPCSTLSKAGIIHTVAHSALGYLSPDQLRTPSSSAGLKSEPRPIHGIRLVRRHSRIRAISVTLLTPLQCKRVYSRLMQTHNRDVTEQSGTGDGWTRRAVLRSAAAFAALGLVGFRTADAATRARGELFAFRSPRNERLVIALVTEATNAMASARVSLHAGNRAWDFDTRQTGESLHGDDRLFTGPIVGRVRGSLRRYDAAVVETRSTWLAKGESVGIWARHIDARGGRRYGNPVVAELVAADPRLAVLRDAGSPIDDFARLEAELISRIARIAERARVVVPQKHAKRVVRRFLPDVLAYRPDAPVGFTFAAQNGRHPVDDVSAVAATILTGTPAGPRFAAQFRISATFPYLLLPANAD